MNQNAIGYWMDETSGVLRPAIEAYLKNDEPMTLEHVMVMRAYLRQWMGADWWGPKIPELRRRINCLATREDLRVWLRDALHEGIDPL